ncbi:hypothetical protein [Cupriavidus sp. USMAHM13]|uniref:hypothetical protein n=1 Tax=Cupriavidus sp. USMAHM13 TaxID=1389192 RepID=UPI0012E9EF26|nr:hypothetical protein [Cupriavidus sp. USMAHM13]
MFHRVRTQARCAAVAVLALVAAVLVSACATRWQDKLKIEAGQHLQQGEFFAAARNVAAIDERFPDDAAPLWPMLTAEPARSRLAVTAPAELATPAWQTESGLRDEASRGPSTDSGRTWSTQSRLRILAFHQ